MKRWLLLCLFTTVAVAVAQSNSISFTFTVPAGPDLRTSAAVLDSTNTMIRTLWANQKLPPGTYTRQWDGTYDQGGTAPTGTYTIKLMMNDVKYHYDWWIGNTDASWISPNIFGRFHAHGFTKIAWVGTQGWLAPNYSENIYNIGLMQKNAPNAPYPVSRNFNNYTIQISDLATDGQFVYLLNHGFSYNYDSFTTVMDGASGRPAFFTNGTLKVGANCNFPNCSPGPNGTWYNTTLSTIDDTTFATTGSINAGSNSLSVANGAGFANGSAVYVTGAGTSGGVLTSSIVSGGGTTGAATLILANNAVTTVSAKTVNLYILQTGIAVQRGGNILAIAHGTTNQIVLFDKTSGNSLGTITGITAPGQMAFNSEGLWVIANGVLYEVTGVGSSNAVAAVPSLGGITFSNVQSVAVNGATNSLVVLDGGTNQQMYEFAVSTHSLMRTYGDLGGFNDCNPTITKTRLNVDNTATTGATTGNGSFVSVDDTDDVWIGDNGNYERILHISPSNQYVNQNMSFHYLYKSAVSKTMPTRLFNHQWEFSINYNVTNVAGDPDPAVGGNGSWALVRNWGVCAQGAHGSPPGAMTNATTGIREVEQLSNGRVYADVTNGSNYHLYELPTSGTSPMRDTGINTYGPAGPELLLRDGSLVYSNKTGTTPSFVVTAYKATLTGFDGSNNPIYGSFVAVGSTTTNATNASLIPSTGSFIGSNGAETTTSGYMPVFWTAQKNNSATTHYPHLAAIKSGFASYAWTTLGEVCFQVPDYLGNFPCKNGFSSFNGIAPIQVEGANIFVGYDGQNVPWGDQYYHVWEDGMIVGQFGNDQGYLYQNAMHGYFQAMRPEQAENIGDISTTTYNGDVYMYHPDEGSGSCHRWHISNLSSIHEWGGSGQLQPNGKITLAPIF